jgi:ABC-type uncharacterized transport system permease subunit
MFNHGNVIILGIEVILLAMVFFYAKYKLIPNYFGNINKKLEAENILKAKKGLYLFTASVFLYIFLEFFGFKAYLLHIVAAVVIMLFVANMIKPFTLKKWGKDSFRIEEITDDDLIEELSKIERKNNKFEYKGYTYFFMSEKFSKQIPVKKPTSKSEFWTGFFAVMIWSFLVINLVYILKVEMGAPEIMVTLLAFIIAYVLSPFYPDLYTTFLFAQDDEVDFEKFVKVEVAGKEYFGSIEKLTFFKVALKDCYNDTLITFFHKLFLGAVMTSYPNGRFIQRDFVVSKEEQDLLSEKIPKWISEFDVKKSLEKPVITFFDHNYGYGVKLRVKVKKDFIKEYGGLKDQLISLISKKSKEEGIDLRTPVLEVSMKGEEK